MAPQTINAYYNPVMNEIVFPAAIMQPPFFDGEMDDAVNYGGMGGVIGHEFMHGFDDQGSRFGRRWQHDQLVDRSGSGELQGGDGDSGGSVQQLCLPSTTCTSTVS